MWCARLTESQLETLKELIKIQGEVGPDLEGALEALELARWDDLPDAELPWKDVAHQAEIQGISEADVHEKWSGELSALLDSFETRKNLSYYVPYFRHDNCSHCVSIPPLAHDTETILNTPWIGTEIEQEGVNLRDYIERLLDPSQPLRNYREAPQPAEAFTPEEVTKCMTP